MSLMTMLEDALNDKAPEPSAAVPAAPKPKAKPSAAMTASASKTANKPLWIVASASDHTEQEAATLIDRVRSFQDKGIAGSDALTLAHRLVVRDRQLDDRRSCAECTSFYAGGCQQQRTPIGVTTIYTLHRCAGFTHEKP